MTLDSVGLEAAAKALSRDEGIALWDEWTPAAQGELLAAAESCVRAYLAAVPVQMPGAAGTCPECSTPLDPLPPIAVVPVTPTTENHDTVEWLRSTSREFASHGFRSCDVSLLDAERVARAERERGFVAGRAAATPFDDDAALVDRTASRLRDIMGVDDLTGVRIEWDAVVGALMSLPAGRAAATPTFAERWERAHPDYVPPPPAATPDPLTFDSLARAALLPAASPDERLREAERAALIESIAQTERFRGGPCLCSGCVEKRADAEAVVDAVLAALAAADRDTACTDRENTGPGGAVTRGIVPNGTDALAAADREKPGYYDHDHAADAPPVPDPETSS